MSNPIEVTPGAWNKAAAAFDSSGLSAAGALHHLVSTTTDPGSCNASGGLATLDGAVTMMLQGFGAVLLEDVLAPLGDVFAGEAAAMQATGSACQEMQDQAEALAREAGR